MKRLSALAIIAQRDFLKFLRDKVRILATFIFPFLFIGVLGTSLQSNLSQEAGYNFLVFVFTGVVGQIHFQSAAAGVISLIEDRKNDFSQELFVTPISRYTIILGKIAGESMVALAQGLGVILFALVMGVPIQFEKIIILAPVVAAISVFGGAFGILVMSNLSSERSANQIFPFVIFPQFFLAGVFSPIKNLPKALDIASKITPMRYAVDLVRGVYYRGTPAYERVVLADPLVNIAVILLMFGSFLFIGTYLFVRNERNR
jgi:ABC-2 type transport system permease protein